MNITIPCSKCGHKYTVDSALAGKRIKCIHCGGVVAIPVPRGQRQPPASSPRVAPAQPSADPYGFLEDEPAADSELPRIEPRSRSAGRKRSNHGVWLLVGGAGALLVLVVGGLWLSNALRSTTSNTDSQQPTNAANSGQQVASGQPTSSSTKTIALPPRSLQLPGAEPNAPGWASNSSDAPFDVKKFLGDRKAAADDCANVYFAALAELSSDMDFVYPAPEWQKRLPRLKNLSETIETLLDEDQLRAGTVPIEPIERLLGEVRPATELIDTISPKSSCLFVSGLRFDTLLPHAQSARQVAKLAELEIYHARAKGRFEDAEKAVRRTLRLARDLRPRGPAICQLASVSMDGLVLNSINELYLGQPGLKPEHCDKLIGILSEHGRLAIDPRGEAVRVEYIILRNSLDDLQSGRMTPEKLAEAAENPAFRALRTSGINWAAEVAACNKFFASAIELATLPQHESMRLKLFDKNVADAKQASSAVWILVPALQQIDDATARDRTRLGATMSLIAVRRYQLVHGKPPETLAIAVKEAGLPDIPIDAYSGQPLRYRVDSGQPIVYSVGSDQKDDGGLADWEFGRKPGDFIFRIAPVAGPPLGAASGVASDPGPRPGPPPVPPIPNFQAATTPQEMARVQAKLESDLKRYHADLLKYHESWERFFKNKYGRDWTIKILVTGVSDPKYYQIVDSRMRSLPGSSGTEKYGTMADGTITFLLAPINDLNAFASKIDFGKVSKVDGNERVIHVTADASKLDASNLDPFNP